MENGSPCRLLESGYTVAVIQIVFNDISAAEMAEIPLTAQVELLSEFNTLPAHSKDIDLGRYGRVERDGKLLYRHRARDYRLYFEVGEDELVVHRVLHKNTIRDFLFRAELPMADEEDVSQAREFWELIEEGKQAKRRER